MTTQLECGHSVDLELDVRLWAYYDTTFAVLIALGTEPDAWHDFVCDGSPYKDAHSSGYYDVTRLACQACGEAEVRRRKDITFNVGPHASEWQLVKACAECGGPTEYAHAGAPGIGGAYWCANGHATGSTVRVQAPWEVV